jgi:hypothetical protein
VRTRHVNYPSGPADGKTAATGARANGPRSSVMRPRVTPFESPGRFEFLRWVDGPSRAHALVRFGTPSVEVFPDRDKVDQEHGRDD